MEELKMDELTKETWNLYDEMNEFARNVNEETNVKLSEGRLIFILSNIAGIRILLDKLLEIEELKEK